MTLLIALFLAMMAMPSVWAQTIPTPDWAVGYPATSGFAAGPNLIDGSAGDTTTFYQDTVNTGSGGGSFRNVTARYDLGSGSTPVKTIKFTGSVYFAGAPNSLYSVDYSNDGTTWTAVQTNVSTTGMSSPAQKVVTVTTATSARYWRVYLKDTNPGAPTVPVAKLFDYRLYDAAGNPITLPSGPSFTLAANPASVSIVQGGSGSVTLTATPSGGFTGNISLAASGVPANVTATFSPTSLNVTGTASVSGTLSFSLLTTAAVGSYTVTVTGTSGSLTASTPVTLVVTAPPTIPAAPTNLIATAVSPSQINLTWTDNSSNEDGFSIERSPNGSSGWAQIATVGVNVAAYSDTGLTANTTYYYRVRAYNTAGNSGYSNVASATTPTAPPPGSWANEFWVTYPVNGMNDTGGNMSTTQFLDIVAGGAAATVTVTVPGNTFTQTVNIAANSSATVQLPIYVRDVTQDGTFNNGVKVVSNNLIQVFGRDSASTNNDWFLCLGLEALGTRYTVASYPTQNLGGTSTEYAVIATQNATTVTISSPTDGYRTVTLNAGQVYQRRLITSGKDLTGTRIQADKPVAAYSGTGSSNIPVGATAMNYLVEALIPENRMGTQFVTVPFATRTGGDQFRVVATYNNTQVWVDAADGATTNPTVTLSSGQNYEVNLAGPHRIFTSKPVQLIQFSRGSSTDGNATADPSMTQVPALSHFVTSASVKTLDNTAFPVRYLNIVAQTIKANAGDIVLNGAAVPAASFTAVTGTLGGVGYSYAQVAISANAVHTLTSATSTPFGAIVYQYGSYDCTATPAGLRPTLAASLPPPPAAPSGLTATPVSSSAIALSWTDNSNNEDGFEIRYRVSGGSWLQAPMAAANATGATVSGLAALTTYEFQARAVNDGGESAWSNTATATTLDNPPNTPTNLTATPISQTQINLAWTDTSGNEQGFRIERKTGANGTWAEIYVTGPNIASYSNTGLTKNTTYVYRVRAYNAVGNSAYSNEATATTFDDPPAAPSGLTATAVSSSQINLAWTDNSSNETSFKIERSPDGSTGWTEIYVTGANVASYSNTGLTANTTYYYRVRASNNGGNSAYSNTASATTLPPPPPPAPTNLVATAVSGTEISLTWTDNSGGVASFVVERHDGAIGANTNWSVIAPNVAAGTTFYLNTGLPSNTTFTYRVKAVASGVSSTWSNEDDATTLAPGVSRPAYLAKIAPNSPAVKVGQSTTLTVTLSVPTSTATAVTLTNTGGVSMPGSVTIPAGSVSAQFTVTGTATTAEFYGNPVTVSAKSGNWIQATVLNVLPSSFQPAMSGLSALPGNNVAYLIWNRNIPLSVKGYRVYRKSGGGSFAEITTNPIADNNYMDTTVSNGVAYDYRVDVVGWDNAATPSSIISVTPASQTTSLSISNATAAATETVIIPVSISGSAAIDTVSIVVDGSQTFVGAASLSEEGNGVAFNVRVSLEELSTGNHTIQAFGVSQNTVFVSPVCTLTVDNDYKGGVEGEFQTSTAERAIFNVKSEYPIDSWEINVIRIDGTTETVVRSWQGFGETLSAAWDGKDANGNTVAVGQYDVEFKQFQANGDPLPPKPKNKRKHIYPRAGLVQAFVLLPDQYTKFTWGLFTYDSNEDLYKMVRDGLVRCGYEEGSTLIIWRAKDQSVMNSPWFYKRFVAYLRTATVFVSYGHGSLRNPYGGGDIPGFWFGPIRVAAYWGANGSWFGQGADADGNKVVVANIGSIVQASGHQYSFVMINSCQSAGGDTPLRSTNNLFPWNPQTGHPAAINPGFAYAFNVPISGDPVYAGTFLGWNGAVGNPEWRAANSATEWRQWTERWWSKMTSGRTISQVWSLSNPNMNTVPWQVEDGPPQYTNYRATFLGDPYETFLP